MSLKVGCPPHAFEKPSNSRLIVEKGHWDDDVDVILIIHLRINWVNIFVRIGFIQDSKFLSELDSFRILGTACAVVSVDNP